MAAGLTRKTLDRWKIETGAEPMVLGCGQHLGDGTTVVYQDGGLRLLCQVCGFEAMKIKVALDEDGDHLHPTLAAAPEQLLSDEAIGEITRQILHDFGLIWAGVSDKQHLFWEGAYRPERDAVRRALMAAAATEDSEEP